MTKFLEKLPLVKTSCVLGLVALVLITWAVLDPRPVPVFLAMSLGQVIGTGSVVLFLAALAMRTPAKTKESMP